MNVTDLAKDHPAIEVTDAGNGHDDRIVKPHALCHFSLHSGNLLIQKFNLSNYGSDLDGQCLVGLPTDFRARTLNSAACSFLK